jgi:hypothetical protein
MVFTSPVMFKEILTGIQMVISLENQIGFQMVVQFKNSLRWTVLSLKDIKTIYL